MEFSRDLKKVTAMFLALLLLFTAFMFLVLSYKFRQDMIPRLDNSDDETVTPKLTMAIPHIDSEEYERVNGDIEYQREFYRLLKQKSEKDTLYIVGMRDIESNRLNQVLADYVKTFTDKPSNPSRHHSTNITSAFIKDFFPKSFEVQHSSNGWIQEVCLSSKPVAPPSAFLV